MSSVLIIDDDPIYVRDLLLALHDGGYDAHHATSGALGVEMAAALGPDAVLLEWTLPDMTGIDVVTRLAADPATKNTPVLFVSARGEEIYRVHAFEKGAVDYVVKPFSTRELLLRIRAILRRKSTPTPTLEDARGALRVDRGGHRVWVEGQEITLTRLEYDLLVTLVDAEEKVLTRAELLHRAWGNEANVTERTIDTHLTRLRAKLGTAAAYVQTVRGRGYRFSCSERR